MYPHPNQPSLPYRGQPGESAKSLSLIHESRESTPQLNPLGGHGRPRAPFNSKPVTIDNAALADLRRTLRAQEGLIQSLEATILSNHEVAMKHAKAHSAELTALFRHVASISEQLSKLNYDQQSEAQVLRMRQLEIYELVQRGQQERDKARKISRHAPRGRIEQPKASEDYSASHHRTRSATQIDTAMGSANASPPQRAPGSPTRASSPLRSPLRSLSPFRSLDNFRKRNKDKSHTSSPTRSRTSKGSSTGSASIVVTPSPKRKVRMSPRRSSNNTAPSVPVIREMRAPPSAPSATAAKLQMYASLRDQQSHSQSPVRAHTEGSEQRRHRSPERMPSDPAEYYDDEHGSGSADEILQMYAGEHEHQHHYERPDRTSGATRYDMRSAPPAPVSGAKGLALLGVSYGELEAADKATSKSAGSGGQGKGVMRDYWASLSNLKLGDRAGRKD